jgi:hypothetical protein
VSLLVLPFVTARLLLWRRVHMSLPIASAVPFLLAVVVVDVLPLVEGTSTSITVVTHLPVLFCSVSG